jgi:hypothetical protein
LQLIFERGRFDAASTAMTAAALACYAPGIVGYSIVKIASPSFYSLREVRTPLIVSLVTIAVNLGLSVWLFHAIGFRGLALGTAIAANVNAVLLLVFLAKRIGGIELGRILNTLARIGIACVPMAFAAVVQPMRGWRPPCLATATWRMLWKSSAPSSLRLLHSRWPPGRCACRNSPPQWRASSAASGADLLASRREPICARGLRCRDRTGADDPRRQGHCLHQRGGVRPHVRGALVLRLHGVVRHFRLRPESLFERLYLWQVATYLFLHDVNGFAHILFNMLALWMFGVDLERRWGSRGFVKYYAITGVGAGMVTALVSLLPYTATRDIYGVDHRGCLRRDLRPADGVGAAVPDPADSVHVHLPACRRAWPRCSWAPWRSCRPRAARTTRSPKRRILRGFRDRLAVPERFSHDCGWTSATGWRDGAWTACAASSTSTKAVRRVGQYHPLRCHHA